MSCVVCGVEVQAGACSRCGSVLYCGSQCQRSDWPRHKPHCRQTVLKITAIPGRGTAVLATGNIKPGTKIYQEKPLLLTRIPASVTEARIVLREEYEEAWADCSPESFRENVSRKLVDRAIRGLETKFQQRLYRSLYDKDEPKTDFGIFLTNALPLADYSLMGVFPVINRMNHACIPNCCVHWNKQTDTLEVFSMENIQIGTELTISYIDLFSWADREARQEYLRKHFYFDCICRLCGLTGDRLVQDDHNRREVKLLYHQLKTSSSDDLAGRLKLMSEMCEYFTSTEYPPSTTWRFHLSTSHLASTTGNLSRAAACLHTAERLLRNCRDKENEDYKLLEEKKSKI